jgi:hypothetical protein
MCKKSRTSGGERLNPKIERDIHIAKITRKDTTRDLKPCPLEGGMARKPLFHITVVIEENLKMQN